MAYNVEFKRGSSTAYKSLMHKDDKVFYYTEDDKQLYLGNVCLTSSIDNEVLNTIPSLQAEIQLLRFDVDNIMGDDTNPSSFAYAIKEAILGISEDIGILNSLTTQQKTTLVDAINEVNESVGGIKNLIGTVPNGYDTVIGYLQDYAMGLASISAADAEEAKRIANEATEKANTALEVSLYASETAEERVKEIIEADTSIMVDDVNATAPRISVRIAPNSGLELRSTGLAVSTDSRQDMIDYTVEVEQNLNGNYTIKQEATGLNAVITIPKDMVVQSGYVKTITEFDGVHEPDTYLVLVLANSDNQEIYIPVSSLIEYVTSGSDENSQIRIDVSDDHRVTATLVSAIAKNQLASSVQDALNKANTAVQKSQIGTAAEANVEDFDAAGSASIAYQNAQNYIDTALTWGIIGE